MPETIRALIVILGLAAGAFLLATRTVSGSLIADEDFARRRNLWVAITLTAFLANNFWIFLVVTAAILQFGLRRENNRLAMYFALMFVVPGISGTISGLGLMDKFFSIEITRLLALVILLPAYLSLRKQADTLPFGRMFPDKLLIGYILLNFFVALQGTTLTDAVRQGIFYAFLDIFLPFYVASRQLKDMKGFREAITAFAVAALLMAIVAIFENLKTWLLYHSLSVSLSGADRWGWNYLPRGDGLRATATAGQPIPLGYVLVVAMAFMLYIRSQVQSSRLWFVMFLVLCGGLIATVSRGPWVGGVAMILVFVATGLAPVRSLFKTALIGGVVFCIALATPIGSDMVDLLPFVGTVDSQNVDYRTIFMERSFVVIGRNPWLGAIDYGNAPEFAELKWQGILDPLNIFFEVTLRSGIVGLLLFGGMFLSVGLGVFKALRRERSVDQDRFLLGRALFGAIVAVIVIINTISSVTIIPLVYWCLLGLGVAYINMVRQTGKPNAGKRALKRFPDGPPGADPGKNVSVR